MNIFIFCLSGTLKVNKKCINSINKDCPKVNRSLRRGTWVPLTLELALKMVWRWRFLLLEWKFRGCFITLTPQKHTHGQGTLESHQLCLHSKSLRMSFCCRPSLRLPADLSHLLSLRSLPTPVSTSVSAAPRAGSPFYPPSCSSDLCSFSRSSWMLSFGCPGYDVGQCMAHVHPCIFMNSQNVKKENKQNSRFFSCRQL